MKFQKFILIFVLLILTMSSVFATFTDPNRYNPDDNLVPDVQVRNLHDAEQGYGDSLFLSGIYYNSTNNKLDYKSLVTIPSSQSSSSSLAPNAPIVCDYDADGDNELITYEGQTVKVYNGVNNTIALENTFSTSAQIVNINCGDFNGVTGDFILSATLGTPISTPFNDLLPAIPADESKLVILTENSVELYNHDDSVGGIYNKVIGETYEIVDLTSLGTPISDLYCTSVLKQKDFTCSFYSATNVIILYGGQDGFGEIDYRIKNIPVTQLNGGSISAWSSVFQKNPVAYHSIKVINGVPEAWIIYQRSSAVQYYHTYLNDTLGSTLTANARIATGSLQQLWGINNLNPTELISSTAYDFNNDGIKEVCVSNGNVFAGINGGFTNGVRMGCYEYGNTNFFILRSEGGTNRQKQVDWSLGVFDYNQDGKLDFATHQYQSIVSTNILADGDQFCYINSETSAYVCSPDLLYNLNYRTQMIRPINIENEDGSQMVYYGFGDTKGSIFKPLSGTTPAYTGVELQPTNNKYTAVYSADLNDDFENEIIAYGSGVIDIYFGREYIAPPDEPNLLLLNGKSNGGYFGFFEGNICQGTEVSIRATQCVDNNTNCNYFSSNVGNPLEKERIYTDWDGASAEQNGSYSTFSPSVTTTFNIIGSYNITAYLEEESSPGLRNAFNTDSIDINVIAGIEGVTCNIPDEYISSPDDNPGGINETDPGNGGNGNGGEPSEDDGNVFSVIANLNPVIKFIVGVLLVLGFAVWTSNNTQGNQLMTIIGASLGLGVAIILQLFAIEIAIIFIIVLIIVITALHKFNNPSITRG